MEIHSQSESGCIFYPRGGRWSPREISMDLREPYEDVRKASARMYDTGSVLRMRRAERSISYSRSEGVPA